MLENVKIGKKLIGGFILTIIIMLIIAGTGFYYIGFLDDQSDAMYDDRLIPIQELGIMNGAFYAKKCWKGNCQRYRSWEVYVPVWIICFFHPDIQGRMRKCSFRITSVRLAEYLPMPS